MGSGGRAGRRVGLLAFALGGEVGVAASAAFSAVLELLDLRSNRMAIVRRADGLTMRATLAQGF